MSVSNQKLKLLYLAKILFEETDEGQGLTMPQIVARLEACGVNAERKAIYDDIKLLNEFGLHVVKIPRAPVEYALVDRQFSQAELLLLADAVQSSRFLTKTMSEKLVRSIKSLGSRLQTKDFKKRLHVEGRIKMQNESVFANVDLIQRAIATRHKVSFQYFQYNVAKKQVPQRSGALYVETPVELVYSDGCYYLVVFNDKHDNFANYRVDRMLNLTVSDEPATRNERIATFDVAAYEARAFGMFSGTAVSVTMLVRESAIGAIIDRFGKDVVTIPAGEGLARVHATVTDSPTFFGWLAQFGTRVTIETPASLKSAYAAYLRQIIEAYEPVGQQG